jgi:hypothetical protein
VTSGGGEEGGGDRFARAAAGNGNGAPPPNGAGRLPPVRITRTGRVPMSSMTPEQTCLGCSLGLLAIAVCAAFWFWFYWRLEQKDIQRQQQRSAPLLRSTPLPATPRTYE